MKQAFCADISNAKASYESKIFYIQQSCACFACKGLKKDEVSSGVRFCSVAVLECIIIMARTLAGITVTPGLCLSRNGIHETYKDVRQERLRRHAGYSDDTKSYTIILPARKPQGPMPRPPSSIYITDALQLFVGSKVSDQQDLANVNAVSRKGLCFFFDSLLEPSIDSEVVGRVHVLPGYIEWEKRKYFHCSDRTRDWKEDPKDEKWFYNRIDQAADICSFDLHIKDTARALELDYRFIDISGRVSGSLGPSALASEAAYCRGFFKCPKRDGCAPLNPSMSIEVSERSRIRLYRMSSPEPSCAAIVLSGQSPKECSC